MLKPASNRVAHQKRLLEINTCGFVFFTQKRVAISQLFNDYHIFGESLFSQNNELVRKEKISVTQCVIKVKSSALLLQYTQKCVFTRVSGKMTMKIGLIRIMVKENGNVSYTRVNIQTLVSMHSILKLPSRLQ